MTSQVGLPDDVDENEEDGRNDEVVGSDRPTSTEHDDSGHRCRHDDDDVTTTMTSRRRWRHDDDGVGGPSHYLERIRKEIFIDPNLHLQLRALWLLLVSLANFSYGAAVVAQR